MKRITSELAINTLSNIAVVGFALAIYEQKWVCMLFATLAYIAAYLIARRLDQWPHGF